METLESMLKTMREFVNFIDQNKQNIFSGVGISPVAYKPVSGCSLCTSNLNSVQNDYLTQILTPLVSKLNGCLDTVNSSRETFKAPQLVLNSINTQQTKPVELFSWCPVEVQVDGDCCLGGIERGSNEVCKFTITKRVLSVSENGQTVYTEGGNAYQLHGGFSWSTFCAVNPSLPLTSPPTGIVNAFSNGFPAGNWRSWTQGLYYFTSTIFDGLEVSATVGPTLKPVNMIDSTPVQQLKDNHPYKHILSSYNVDSHIVNTLCTLDKDLPTKNHAVKFKNVKSKHQPIANESSGIAGDENNLSTTAATTTTTSDFSYIPSVSEVCEFKKPSNNLRKRKPSKKVRIEQEEQDGEDEEEEEEETGEMDDEEEEGDCVVMQKTNPQHQHHHHHRRHDRHHHVNKTARQSERALYKSLLRSDMNNNNNCRGDNNSHRRNNNNNNPNAAANKDYDNNNKAKNGVVSQKHRRNQTNDDDPSDIDERYRLYTASGKVVDVRQLGRTRSGRLSLPKLDKRYEQSIVMNQGHVLGVNHNVDDETILSWLSSSDSS
ncbi:unnamed protein product [Trichobilharzia szidati]|nr:unnamed protein product [Trichobilharzia szidati]